MQTVLDMTSRESNGNREICVDLARENPRILRRMMIKSRPRNQRTLEDFFEPSRKLDVLIMPTTLNWETMGRIYEFQPASYEELVSLRGVGPSTIRGLSHIAELVYGQKPSWMDPVRFSFAFGGKDGVPFPVDRRGMDEAVEVLKGGIEDSKLGQREKLKAVQRLRRCVPPIPEERLI
jgi:hypothetical protein